jgi:hypothetical protein
VIERGYNQLNIRHIILSRLIGISYRNVMSYNVQSEEE